ncbi:hypothetical protein [Streptomyces sp. B6B3]|uniref:hypothetical protein n=1 Tax=Streptomyces sp. B6B3 TaxID=3153570 RepID=UPI00325EE875
MSRNERANEAFADSEQQRADGLAWRIDQISSDPSNPSNAVLPHYQAAYQQASGNAAANTAQPKSKRGWGS